MEYWKRQAAAENLTQNILAMQSVRMAQMETETVQSWLDDTMAKINYLRGTYADEKQNAAKWRDAMDTLKSWQKSRKLKGAMVRKPRRSNGV